MDKVQTNDKLIGLAAIHLDRTLWHDAERSQDCSQFKNGAFTGDISAEMIKKIGCKYVLIGHSERRTLYNETNPVFIPIITSIENNSGIFCYRF